MRSPSGQQKRNPHPHLLRIRHPPQLLPHPRRPCALSTQNMSLFGAPQLYPPSGQKSPRQAHLLGGFAVPVVGSVRHDILWRGSGNCLKSVMCCNLHARAKTTLGETVGRLNVRKMALRDFGAALAFATAVSAARGNASQSVRSFARRIRGGLDDMVRREGPTLIVAPASTSTTTAMGCSF